MLFLSIHSNGVLHRAVKAAVASHRPGALRALLASHGHRAFAKGLSGLSSRVTADALTMLCLSDSIRVQRCLPRVMLKRLGDLNGDTQRATNRAHSERPFLSFLPSTRLDAILNRWHRAPCQPHTAARRV